VKRVRHHRTTLQPATPLTGTSPGGVTYFFTVHRFTASTSLLALATLLAPASEGADRACPRAARPFPSSGTTIPCWTGPDGARLPFEAFEEVEEFLDAARVLEVRGIGEGRSKPKKLLLERDGVRAHAIFRHVDFERRERRLDDRRRPRLRDSYRNGMAAYAIARLLGFNRVPPIVERSLDGSSGSFQLWIEDAMMEKQRRRDQRIPPDVIDFDRQLQMLDIFDALVCNIDRNLGNILIDGEWNVWYIDHTRTFSRFRPPPTANLGPGIDRGVWQRLERVDDEELRAAVAPWLGSWEVHDLLERRRQMVDRFRIQIAGQGELNAFF